MEHEGRIVGGISKIAYWFGENVLTVVMIIGICILILLMVGLLIYLAVIGVCNIIKNIRGKRK